MSRGCRQRRAHSRRTGIHSVERRSSGTPSFFGSDLASDFTGSIRLLSTRGVSVICVPVLPTALFSHAIRQYHLSKLPDMSSRNLYLNSRHSLAYLAWP